MNHGLACALRGRLEVAGRMQFGSLAMLLGGAIILFSTSDVKWSFDAVFTRESWMATQYNTEICDIDVPQTEISL